jgi:GNAT superfamily N-acetyltransferase
MTDRKPGAEFSIRPFAPRDTDGVHWLFARTPPWGRTYPRPQPIPDDLADPDATYPAACFVAVEQDRAGEAVIAFGALAPVTEGELPALPAFEFMDGPAWRVHWVSVAAERWRTGVGRALTLRLIEEARARGAHWLVLDTTVQQEGAISLYEACGFARAGQDNIGEWRVEWFRLAL